MTATTRRWILRANGLYLLLAAMGGLLTDVLGIFFSHGPVSPIVGGAPLSGSGFVEAHGLVQDRSGRDFDLVPRLPP